jgi:hypothetical protein
MVSRHGLTACQSATSSPACQRLTRRAIQERTFIPGLSRSVSGVDRKLRKSGFAQYPEWVKAA